MRQVRHSPSDLPPLKEALLRSDGGISANFKFGAPLLFEGPGKNDSTRLHRIWIRLQGLFATAEAGAGAQSPLWGQRQVTSAGLRSGIRG